MTHPSGSKINAMSLIFPSVNLFLNGTPSCSKRAQASWISGTVIAMWPNPFPGSVLPEAYPENDGSDSVPWLCVNSRTPSRREYASMSVPKFGMGPSRNVDIWPSRSKREAFFCSGVNASPLGNARKYNVKDSNAASRWCTLFDRRVRTKHIGRTY